MRIYQELEGLVRQFRDQAQSVDAADAAPFSQLQQLARIGYFDFAAEAAPGPRRRCLDLLSSGCGVTSFLATQHEGVCRRLVQAGHPWAPKARTGEMWFGVCFAHLRRNPSPVEAIEFPHQVIFSGTGPWFSGHGIFPNVLVGGATQSGRFVMGLSTVNSPEIAVRELPRLAVMNATATVGFHFNALPVPKEHIIVDITPEELAQKDMHSTVFQAARSLGAARAASSFLSSDLAQGVEQQLELQHSAMEQWDKNPSWAHATELRKIALRFTRLTIEAAFVSTGGKAHSLSHPLQRIAREANFYYTTQLTNPLRTAVNGELERFLDESLLPEDSLT